MQLEDSVIWEPLLTDAIDRYPLTITPEIPLIEAIARMNHVLGSNCLISNDISSENLSQIPRFKSSCILVVAGEKILGILTERDIVRLTAEGKDFEQTSVAEVMTKPVITLAQPDLKHIFGALFLFRRYQIRHLPIVDEQNRLIGVISPERIRQVLQPIHLLKLRKISEVMTSNVIQAPPTATLENIAQLMSGFRVSCVVITQPDADDRYLPIGMITERDIVQFKLLKINFSRTFATEVMSQPLFLVSPEDSLWKAHQEMKKRHIRRLVVSWNWGRGLGLITQTRILKIFDPIEMNTVMSNLEQTLENIETKSPGLKILNSSEFCPEIPSKIIPSELLNLGQNKQAYLQKLTDILASIEAKLEALIWERYPECEPQKSEIKSILTEVKRGNYLLENYANSARSERL